MVETVTISVEMGLGLDTVEGTASGVDGLDAEPLSPARAVAAEGSESVLPQDASKNTSADRTKNRIYPAGAASSTGAVMTLIDVWERINWCILCHT